MATPDDQPSAPTAPAASPRMSGAAGVTRLVAEGLGAVRGFRTIFTDLSFAAGPGELVVVTGPNGVGKSTLLRIVAGLMPPAAGRVTLEPVDDEAGHARIHYFGHQDGLKTALSVERNLDFWRRFWGGGDVDDALDRVGLGHLASLPVGVLSAGQKRRVALARMLLVERPVWLLDEPLTALDAAAEATFAELLAAHLAGGGMAFAATHRPLPVPVSQTIAMGEGTMGDGREDFDMEEGA